MTAHKRLTLFFYLLIRDEVPLGTVARIMQEVERSRRDDCNYTNDGLKVSATDFADRIIYEPNHGGLPARKAAP